MASIRHLGLFPKHFGCVSDKFNIDDSLDWRSYPDLWMQKSDVVAMYWRVKKWQVTHDISWVFLDEEETFNLQEEISIGQYKTFYTPLNGETEEESLETPLTKETQLICPFSIPQNPFRLFGLETDTETDAGTILTQIQWSAGMGTQGLIQNVPLAFYRPPNDFLPTISYVVNLIAGNTSLDIYASNVPTNFDPLGDGPVGSFSYEFLGKTFTSDIYSLTRSESSDISGLNVVSSLVATEYWPYDPGDGGGPIYDSATGAQLRPFPN